MLLSTRLRNSKQFSCSTLTQNPRPGLNPELVGGSFLTGGALSVMYLVRVDSEKESSTLPTKTSELPACKWYQG